MAERRARSAVVALVSFAVLLPVALLFGALLLVRTVGDQAARPTSAPAVSASLDPETGLVWVDLEALPPQAAETVARIERGGPFPYAQDGQTFGNREDLLPERPTGYYREYTVETPGSDDRGARRVVTGDDDQEFFYTDDHYASFVRIRR